MNDPVTTVIKTICFLLMGIGGWISAHNTISTDCQRLGSFYVNQKTFICEEKK